MYLKLKRTLIPVVLFGIDLVAGDCFNLLGNKVHSWLPLAAIRAMVEPKKVSRSWELLDETLSPKLPTIFINGVGRGLWKAMGLPDTVKLS